MAGIPAPTHTIITGPSAVLGKLFSITKNGSNTFDKNFDHHSIIATITPITAPDKNPTIVSKQVIPMCSNNPFDDKLTRVSQILEGWLIIKLSIIFAFAKTSQRIMNPSTSEICATITNTLSLICFCKYFFLSSDIISFFIKYQAPSIRYQSIY